MRNCFLLLLVGAVFLSSANAAPRSKSKAQAKSKAPTKRRPVATTRATPLSPAQLKGKVVYILDRDVWALDPQSRRKTLLYEDLFFPANKDNKAFNSNYGGSVSFDRANIAWSPDLTQVAFTYYDPRFQGSELFVMRWDGTQKRQLSSDKYKWVIYYPRWSPDGKTVMVMRNSPYRMGGPGYGSADVVLVGLDGVARSFNTRNEKGEPLSGTFLNPYWGRDGRRILLSYSTESADYVDGTNTSLKVVSLDETPVADFQNNWSDFLVDNQSRNGVWQLRHKALGGRSFWERYRSGTIAAQGIIWGEDDGFKADRFCISDDGQQFVAQAQLPRWKIDAQGVTSSDYTLGIWSTGERQSPRLLVEDGRVVDWF